MIPFKIRRQNMRVVKRRVYNGCVIEILDNAYWSFRYEWRVRAIKSQQRRRMLRQHKMMKNKARNFTLHDPTSALTVAYAMDSAKVAINELNCPGWWKQ